ncbi:MAG: DNA polymerase I [Ignavibacteriae bacterium]|nr:DNA polymerase I [Ignavibacteriota bacterium]MCB9216179.1 DNA polymerase I [Ignavibacteria bacterium]
MRLFLIDGMAVLFRGYFALLNAGLRSREGEPTGATFAFISTLERLLEQEKPDLLAVAWDSAEPTFRHDQYEDYKANRAAFPEEMIPQLKRVKEVIEYYHIPSLQLPGYEADDIIGTVARRAEAKGHEVFCVTPDKDFMQLVSDKIKVYRPTKPGQPLDIVDIEGVKEKFGVTPEQVIDVLALMGDSSDNVPGVKGVGEKTAIPLIQQFGSVEGLYERIEEVEKKGVKTKLVNDRENAFLSKELVTIHTEVPLDVPFESLTLDPPDVPQLIRSFDLLGFKSLIKRYAPDGEEATLSPLPSTTPPSSEKPSVDTQENVAEGTEELTAAEEDSRLSFDFSYQKLQTIADTEHEYVLVHDIEMLDELLKELNEAEWIAFDLETDSTDEHQARIVGLSFSNEEKKGYYVPIEVEEIREEKGADEGMLFDSGEDEPPLLKSDGLPLTPVIDRVRPLLGNPAVKKIGQNAKFDMLILRRHNVVVSHLGFDTMLAAYVIDSSGAVGMDALAERYLNYRPVSITELIGAKGKGQKTMISVPVEQAADYACEDADITFQLKGKLAEALEKEELTEVAEKYEFPLVPVLTEMEYTGIKVDTEALGEISEMLGKTMETLESEIYELAGHPFTINSPKQLQEVLFTEQKLPTKKKTKTGYSTDQFVLEELAALHPLPEKILEYRQAAKLKSTYVDALPALINPRTGRIHTSYNQAVTATGRLSSNNPNLQNIPIRSETGREIRKAFVPGIEDGVLVAADYSQIELRIMAHICGDPALVDAFANDFDIHTATAMKVFGAASADEVEPNMRRKAKEVNFGIMYGIGPVGLARRLKIPNNEGKELIDAYFREYPGVRDYINGILQQLRENGTVATLSGRRRYYGNPDNLRNPQRGMAERAAINMPIQGTAADIIKLAMIDLHATLKNEFPNASMLLQVHDELIFEGPANEADDLAAFVKEKMENAFSLGEVKLIAEAGIGKNWFEAH